ncbi:MAG TPA: GntR family transcriptional regulator [Burkholderiales bacterium]|nr:GntR family transcriptional regulator [Burkholderiales bacterium]
MKRPLYERIACDLRRRITSGKLPVGQLLPTEAALCKRYGVSRHTAREALRRLRDAGLITRRRRAGTTVSASSASMKFSLPLNSAEDLFRYASGTRFLIESRGVIRAGPAEAKVLRCRPGQAWFRILGTRKQRGSRLPFALTTVYLHETLSALGRRLPQSGALIYTRVEEALGTRIAWIDQSMEAVTLDAQPAQRLRARAGGCALRVRRYFYDANERLLEVSDSLHPAGRFAYAMRLRRDKPEGSASRP